MGDGDGSRQAAQVGVAYGLAAYTLWGVFPLFFAAMFQAGATPWEVLAHRVWWSCLLLAGLVSLHGRWRELWQRLRDRRVLLTLAASTLLIGVNWLTFLYAVDTRQVLQASLGYFLTPLANVLLGVCVLGERLRAWQLASVGLAVLGVICMAAGGGAFPWIALVLAITFALYGLARKMVAVDSLLGLTVETLLLAPLSLLFLGWWYGAAHGAWPSGYLWLLLIASGAATATPLLCFASAARRLRLVTIGFLQYVGPTIQFLIAVLVLHEAFTREKLLSFAFIWAAVAVYSLDSLLAYRRMASDIPAVSPALVAAYDAEPEQSSASS